MKYFNYNMIDGVFDDYARQTCSSQHFLSMRSRDFNGGGDRRTVNSLTGRYMALRSYIYVIPN